MEQTQLNLLETRDALVAALSTLASKADYLNQLDQALGDGDHGSTIGRGSEAAIRDLQTRTFTTVNQEFEAIGSAMMNSMGGASGILFGVLFRSARNCPASETMNAATLAGFLRRGLDDLKRKSPAAVGDKTMMDALVPAVEALEAKQGESLAAALGSAAEAAKQGAQSTVGMLARYGRATALGERVRSAQDPGATSIALFLESLTAAAGKRGTN
jgi:dihydroxyacetone kinase-like protein